ncbi:MAG: hypothetical protein ABEI52_12930, partial [Halobacteriaceae archaeon]
GFLRFLIGGPFVEPDHQFPGHSGNAPLLVGRIVPEGIADGFLIYFALLGGILALAYWSVYRGGIDEIRRRVNL